MGRIFLINQHVVPVFTDIANQLQKNGADVLLFAGLIEKGGVELSPDVQIVASAPYNRKSAASRLFSWIFFSSHCVLYLVFSRGIEKIVTTTNPPFSPLFTCLIASVRNIPYHVILYDLYPDALVQANLVKEVSWIVRAWSRVNRIVFQRAVCVITLSESMKNAARKYGDARFQVIPNWADGQYLRPLPKSDNPFVRQFYLEGKTVILYAGNMGLTHDLESLVEAAFLLKENTDLMFVFAGDGAKRDRIHALVKENKLNNVLFLPYQDAKSFPWLMACADIGVVTLGKGAEGISVPSKTYSNLAAGLCLLVIAPTESEVSRLTMRYDVGVTCEPEQPHRLATTIELLTKNPDRLLQYKRNSRLASARFGIQNAAIYVSALNP